MKNLLRNFKRRLAEPSSMASIAALGAIQVPNLPHGIIGILVNAAIYTMIAFGILTPEGFDNEGN